MKTLPIEGTLTEVSFYDDDTIERVRELIAINQGSHPDRLFVQIRVTLPEGYYATPKEWTALFFRLSRDGRTITEDDLRTYLTDVRPGVADFPARAYTQEDWEAVSPKAPVRDGGQEWHILGAKTQTILPLPPKDVQLPANAIPLLSLQSLLETLHPFPVSELRVTPAPAAPSDAVLRAYFPRLDLKTTPVNLDASKPAILKAQADLGALLALPVKRHTSAVLTKAKWYIPLNATRLAHPRSTFEQIFYGLTVSETTPFIAYSMTGETALRSKFYVEDPKTKSPVLDPSLVKAWYESTKPNRRRPTLLLYRGSSRSSFQRIAMTSIDITIDIRKDKTSTKTLEEMQAEAEEWLLSLDAIVPFLDPRDLSRDRWTLTDMSLLATYAKEETDFDMLRFPCLRSIFGEEGGSFRLLRVDQGTVPRRLLDACQVLAQEDATPTPEFLANALGTSTEEATALLAPILSGEVNCDRALQDFPVLRFSRKEVEIDFATTPERVLLYADILRYVLTSDAPAVNAVCPRRQEAVSAVAAVPQMKPAEEEDDDDDDGFDISALTVSASAAPPPPAVAPAKKSRVVKVAKEQTNTQNYFNAELKKFNAELFGPPYSKECEKNNQVVVLTPEAKETIRAEKGEAYTYEEAPEDEQVDIPGGTAICPPYWCMTDLIPLRADQLVEGPDGALHCPVCNGKVRPNDKVSTREFPVIKRETSKGVLSPYPRFLKKREGVPCCYPTPAKEPVTLNQRSDVTYVLTEDLYDVPPKRVARLSADLASRLGVKTSYDTTIVNKRLEFGAEDVFRIGLGRPRDTLPEFLGPTPIKSPAQNQDSLRQCSFFSTLRAADPVAEAERRWTEKTLDPIDELEYLSFVFSYSVILVSVDRGKVLCGFRPLDIAARSKTLVVLLRSGGAPELLGTMRRKRKGKGESQKRETVYTVDVWQSPLAEMTLGLRTAHEAACRGDLPTQQTAWEALQELGVADFIGITDPLGRLQGFLAPGVVWIPFVPTSQGIATEAKPATTRALHEVPEADLPTYEAERDALNALKKGAHLFRHEPSKDRRNSDGQVVEVETVTGFRIPVRSTESSPGPTTEVLQTVRTAPSGEAMLLSGEPDSEGPALKAAIDYSSELYEFLLFSLANDIAVDRSGECTDVECCGLRDAIVNRKAACLEKELAAWYKARVDETIETKAYEFISKVRTPCGQLKGKTCEDSLLCGWVKDDGTDVCKIQVRTTQADPNVLLKRLRRTLLENDKQRALVLDNRFSRFFSTMLFQELPHEKITVL